MSDPTAHVVVIDATVGDGPALVAAAAASIDLDVEVVVVGDEAALTQALSRHAHDAERLRVVHAPPPTRDPAHDDAAHTAALHAFSIDVAMRLAARDPRVSVISAGHSGAVVRAAGRRLTRVLGIPRPALAAVVPTLRYRGDHNDPFALLLDVGAGARAGAGDLVAFARMGAVYAGAVSGNARPTVALLSNSRRPDSAPRAIADAHEALLREDDDRLEYLGLVQADQIPQGDADVIVTDGYTGSVVLRAFEGVAATGEQLLAKARERFTWRLGVSMLGAGMDRLRALTHWESYGGAPLLGFANTVIVTEEHANAHALFNAIRLAGKVERLEVRLRLGDLTPR